MKVAISGASGMLGSALSKYLTDKKFTILNLVRRPVRSEDEIFWDPFSGIIEREKLEGIDAVVNFSGKNIGLGRWTKKRKIQLLDSRVKCTLLLSKTLADLAKPPSVFLSSSAIGFYGDRGVEMLNEGAERGEGFLPDLCADWESATKPAMKVGIKVIQMRTGVVLSNSGGALSMMLTPFKLGLGGKLGSGNQYFSWIMIEDYVRAVFHLLKSNNIQLPVNIVSPNAVTNKEFTKTLGRILNRPVVLPLPSFVLKLLLGQVANEVLLSSTRVIPQILTGSGFEFKYPTLEDGLSSIL